MELPVAFSRDYIQSARHIFADGRQRILFTPYADQITCLTDGEHVYALAKTAHECSAIFLPADGRCLYVAKSKPVSVDSHYDVYGWSAKTGNTTIDYGVDDYVICRAAGRIVTLDYGSSGVLSAVDARTAHAWTEDCIDFAPSAGAEHVLCILQEDRLAIVAADGIRQIVRHSPSYDTHPLFISDDGDVLAWLQVKDGCTFHCQILSRRETHAFSIATDSQMTFYASRDGGQMWVGNDCMMHRYVPGKGFTAVQDAFPHANGEPPLLWRPDTRQRHGLGMDWKCSVYNTLRDTGYFYLQKHPQEWDGLPFHALAHRNADGSDTVLACDDPDSGGLDIIRFAHNDMVCIAATGPAGLRICYVKDGFAHPLRTDTMPYCAWGSVCYDAGNLVVFQEAANDGYPHVMVGRILRMNPLNPENCHILAEDVSLIRGERLSIAENVLITVTARWWDKQTCNWDHTLAVMHLNEGTITILEHVAEYCPQAADGSFFYRTIVPDITSSDLDDCAYDLWHYTRTGKCRMLAHHIGEIRFLEGPAAPA